MFAEHKGPIVLSATVHFVGVLALLIASMVLPKKTPEPFVFEMYGEPGPQVSSDLPTLKPLTYESEDIEMPDPKLFEPEIPEPIPEPVRELVPYEPVPDPEPVVEKVPEKPKLIRYEDFGAVKDPQNVRTKPVQRKVDLSSVNRDLQKMIASSSSSSSASTMSSGDKRSLEAYFNTLMATIRDAVEIHTPGPVPLVTEVNFFLAANGSITGARITKSSGDSVYDQKVLAAFRSAKVRYFQPTPFGDSHDLNLAVRQRD